MRWLLFIVIAAMGMFKGHSQALVQTYTDRCTGEVKVMTVQMNSSTVVAYYDRSRVFTSAEFTNGTLQSWLEETYNWWQALSPCSTGNANNQSTQNTTSQATTNATNAASNATGNATNNATSGTTQTTTTGTTGTTGTGSSNTNTGNGTSGTTGSSGTSGSSGSNNNSGGTSSGSGSSSGGSSGSSNNDNSGGSSSGNDSGGETSGGSSSGGSDDSGGTDNSGDSGSSSDSDNSSGDGDSSDGSSSGEGESDSSGESEESGSSSENEESSNEESSEESTESSEEEKKEDEKVEEEKKEEKEEEKKEDKEEEKEEDKEEEKKEDEEEEEEKKEENKEEEEEEVEEEEKRLAPPIVSANLVTSQMMDGVLTQAASFGYSQSSLTGEATYAANAMVWSNLQQYSLNLSKSHVFFKYDKEVDVMIDNPFTGTQDKLGSYWEKGSIMKVQSISAGYMRMFSTHIATVGISDVYLGQKDNKWKGFVGGWAMTGMGVFLEGGNVVSTAAFTGFATKPFAFKNKLTVSPMIALSMSPAAYDFDSNTVTFNPHATWIGGSNFDFNLTQRFKANIGGTLIGSTQKGIPLSWAVTVGSRFQF